MKGSCHMCGKCCEAIHIQRSPEDIANRAIEYLADGLTDMDNDVVFIHLNWTPITKEEAYKINPYFTENERVHGANYDSLYFYTCKHHDKKTRLCTIHEIRPQVCSGYPWYDNPPSADLLAYSPDCGYLVDMTKEDRG